MRPIISYYGGKQKIAADIVALIPPHKMYVEPFFGGGAVLFAKGIPTCAHDDYHEVINDADERLINFYRVFQGDDFKKLYRKILFTPHSEAEYRLTRSITREEVEADDITRAWAYYINISQSFANKLNSGWARSRKAPNKNRGSIWHNQKGRLLALHHRLSRATISCADALKVIAQRDHENTFFYLDPPYPGTGQGHYKGYTVKDLQALIDVLAAIKGKFLLSNFNQPEVKFPTHWKRFEIATTCAVARENKERTEVLWGNYPIHEKELSKQESFLM